MTNVENPIPPQDLSGIVGPDDDSVIATAPSQLPAGWADRAT